MNGAALLLLVVSSALAACVGPSPPDDARGPLPRPVAIQDEGSLVQGASQEWEWPLEKGYAGFTAKLCITGTVSASRFAGSGATVVLEGPNMRKAVSEPALAADRATCLVDYAADRDAAAGPWRLNITAGPSPATFHVEVHVSY